MMFVVVVLCLARLTRACDPGDAVWTALARGRSCGARIKKLVKKGKSEKKAKIRTARKFPDICGPCDPKFGREKGGNGGKRKREAPRPDPKPVGAPAPTCEDVWDTPAPYGGEDYSCGERITYLRTDMGMSESAARRKVAGEIPSVCGPCAAGLPDDGGNNGGAGGDGGVSEGAGFSVVTQNLYWWKLFDQRGGGNFFEMFGRYKPYDIMLFQECGSVSRIRDGLGLRNTHNYYDAQHGLAISWNKARFEEISRGFREVGEDRPGLWGSRGVAWMRLKDNQSAGRTLWVGSHHGPLPINTGGRTGGSRVAANLLALVADTREAGDAVILAGDFNADTGSSTVAGLKRGGLELRASDWVDHVFTQRLGEATTKIIYNTGSDHRGIKLTF